jgi:hypothetical protein
MIVGDDLLQARWARATDSFRSLKVDAGLDATTVSESVGIFQMPGVTADEFGARGRSLQHIWQEPEWRVTQPVGIDGKPLLWALPVPVDAPKVNGLDFLFVDTHSAIADWWLLTAWRADGLVEALDGQQDPIVAATLARSLLESAASFWGDAKRVHGLWSEAKAEVGEAGHAAETWVKLWHELEVITDGSKFSDRAAEAKATWGKFQRRNVLTEIQSLNKVTDVDVEDIYEWLCNVVHPSVGTMVLHSDLWFNHVSGSFRKRLTRRKTLADAMSTSSDRSAVLAIAEGGTVALEVVTLALDGVLRVLDDVGLTCRVADYSKFASWRLLRVPEQRNQPCPCRSGRKTKACSHSWTTPAPEMPTLTSGSEFP